MAAAAILNFGKNVNNFGLDNDILHQIIWEDASRRRGDDHVTKSRNRKLIRVTSSNECLKHMCVDLSDYNRYLTKLSIALSCTISSYLTLNNIVTLKSRSLKMVPSESLSTVSYSLFMATMVESLAVSEIFGVK